MRMQKAQAIDCRLVTRIACIFDFSSAQASPLLAAASTMATPPKMVPEASYAMLRHVKSLLPR